MDPRVVYNFQVGFQLFPIMEQAGDAWPPSWAGDDILAWLRLRVWGVNDSAPELLMRSSAWETLPSPQCRLRPDHLSLTDGDPDTADLLGYFDLAYSNVHAATWMYGAYFQLMSAAYVEDDYFTYFLCSPGYYSDTEYRYPFVRIQNAALVIPDDAWAGDDTAIPTRAASIWWDEDTHKLMAKDNAGNTYTIGP